MTSQSASARIILCAVLAMLAVGTLGSSIATAQEVPAAVTVKYADLNLNSEEGSRVLYQRLVAAAERICPPRSNLLAALRENRAADKCIAEVVDHAVKQVKSPRFAEVAAAHRR